MLYLKDKAGCLRIFDMAFCAKNFHPKFSIKNFPPQWPKHKVLMREGVFQLIFISPIVKSVLKWQQSAEQLEEDGGKGRPQISWHFHLLELLSWNFFLWRKIHAGEIIVNWIQYYQYFPKLIWRRGWRQLRGRAAVSWPGLNGSFWRVASLGVKLGQAPGLYHAPWPRFGPHHHHHHHLDAFPTHMHQRHCIQFSWHKILKMFGATFLLKSKIDNCLGQKYFVGAHHHFTPEICCW